MPPQLVEFGRRQVALDGQVLGRWLEILAHRRAGRSRPTGGRPASRKSPRSSRPGRASGRSWSGCRAASFLAWARTFRLTAYWLLRRTCRCSLRHRLHVVIEDLRARPTGRFRWLLVALEVGREDLDGRAGPLANGQDALAEMLGAAVGEVVSRDAGDDHVLQAEAGTGFGEAFGLIQGHGLGLTPRHGAEAAWAGAGLAQDHEGRGLSRPAFRAIRALAALADRLQLQFADQILRRIHPARFGDRSRAATREGACADGAGASGQDRQGQISRGW